MGKQHISGRPLKTFFDIKANRDAVKKAVDFKIVDNGFGNYAVRAIYADGSHKNIKGYRTPQGALRCLSLFRQINQGQLII